MATGGVGISDTRHHGSPEHTALIESHCFLVNSISQSPKEIADILVPLHVLSQDDKADIRSDGLNDMEKARKIVKILTDKVELDPSFYHVLIANLTKNQLWMKSCLKKVRENFDNAKQAEISHNSEMDSENDIVCTLPKQPVGLYTHLESVINPSEKFEEDQLEKDTKEMKNNFASLEVCVLSALIEDGVTPRALISYLQRLEAVESDMIKAKSILYFDENFIKIAKEDCLVVYDVFDMIRDYYSWVNYGLLENIIDTFLDKNKVIRNKRKLYEDQYKTYCKRRVCKIPTNRFMKLFSSRRQGTEIVFKIDGKWNEIRMERIETIRDRINMVFKFKPHTLSLKTVRKGCVEVTFEIPEHVADVVLPLTEEQVQILKQHSITLIAICVSQYIGGTTTQPSLGGTDNEQMEKGFEEKDEQLVQETEKLLNVTEERDEVAKENAEMSQTVEKKAGNLEKQRAESKRKFEQQLSDDAEQSKQQQAQKDEELRATTHELETCKEQLEESKEQLTGAREKEEQLKSEITALKKEVEYLRAERKTKEELDQTIQRIQRNEKKNREESAPITKETSTSRVSRAITTSKADPSINDYSRAAECCAVSVSQTGHLDTEDSQEPDNERIN